MAKFNFRNEVQQADVDQALKLMDYSFKTLERLQDGNNKARRLERDNQEDQYSKVMSDIRVLFQRNHKNQMNSAEIINSLQRENPTTYNQRGINKDNILDTLNHYSKRLQVLYIDDEENVVFL